jgi:dynein heavy chain
VTSNLDPPPQVIHCIENGLPLLLENLPVDIDAVLDPVIGKQTIRRGRNIIMKIGDAEVRIWGWVWCPG